MRTTYALSLAALGQLAAGQAFNAAAVAAAPPPANVGPAAAPTTSAYSYSINTPAASASIKSKVTKASKAAAPPTPVTTHQKRHGGWGWGWGGGSGSGPSYGGGSGSGPSYGGGSGSGPSYGGGSGSGPSYGGGSGSGPSYGGGSGSGPSYGGGSGSGPSYGGGSGSGPSYGGGSGSGPSYGGGSGSGPSYGGGSGSGPGYGGGSGSGPGYGGGSGSGPGYGGGPGNGGPPGYGGGPGNGGPPGYGGGPGNGGPPGYGGGPGNGGPPGYGGGPGNGGPPGYGGGGGPPGYGGGGGPPGYGGGGGPPGYGGGGGPPGYGSTTTTTTSTWVTTTTTTSSTSACPTTPEKGTYCGFINPEDPCAPQPSSTGAPQVQPDNVSTFLNYPAFKADAMNAATPSGYEEVFQDLDASISGASYLTSRLLQTYDVQGCANYCDQTSLCTAFNIFIERDPSQNPTTPSNATADSIWGNNCPNPSSITNYQCTLWGSPITAAMATNQGQYRDQFEVVITGSNGYDKSNTTAPPTQTGYNPPQSCGGQAISSGGQWCFGSNFFPGPFNPGLCSLFAEAQVAANMAAAKAAGLSSYTPCNMFNAYYVFKDEMAVGTYCALFDTALNSTFANWSGANIGGSSYSCGPSWTYTASTYNSGKF